MKINMGRNRNLKSRRLSGLPETSAQPSQKPDISRAGRLAPLHQVLLPRFHTKNSDLPPLPDGPGSVA